MRRFTKAAVAAATTVIATAAVASVASAAPQLKPFGTGDTTVSGGTVTIDNEAGEYGGVYVNAKALNNKSLADVVVEFTSTGDVAGGAPRFSIPIDTNGNGKFESGEPYAFLDANNTPSNGESVWVSTDNPDSPVFLNTGPSYENWDAFAAANPSYRVAKGATPFIIADVEGSYEIQGIDLQ